MVKKGIHKNKALFVCLKCAKYIKSSFKLKMCKICQIQLGA